MTDGGRVAWSMGGVVPIILNWRQPNETNECLRQLWALDRPPRAVVVVDNGSGDGSLERIRAALVELTRVHGGTYRVFDSPSSAVRPSGVEAGAGGPGPFAALLRAGCNLGYAGGNNLGIDFALAHLPHVESVLLLNNDARVPAGTIEALLEAGADAGAGVVGAIIDARTTGEAQFRGVGGARPRVRQFFQPLTRLRPTAPSGGVTWADSYWVSGAAMLIHRSVLDAVQRHRGQVLDESLFLYGEEPEFCETVRSIGYRVVVAHDAVILHGEAESSGGRGNPLAYYYNSRNRTILANRLLAAPWLALFHPLNLALGVARACKSLLQARPRSAVAVLEGLVDGYRGRGGRWARHDQARQTAVPSGAPRDSNTGYPPIAPASS